MGDKVYTLVIHVDLSCCRCQKCIRDYLCKLRCEAHIVSIVYEEKDNTVLVSGPFDPEKLKRKLHCKFPKIIKCITIKEPSPPPPPPPQIDCKKVITECLEKWQVEFEAKCKKEYESMKKQCEDMQRKCKEECKKKCCKQCKEPTCKCETDCENRCCKPCKEPKCRKGCEKECCKPCVDKPICKPKCVKPCLPQGCCAAPCPCYATWCNNYRCCSCGTVGWPRWWGSEPCPSNNLVICESPQPCSIM